MLGTTRIAKATSKEGCMFHKVKQVDALDGWRLCVSFAGGQTKIYDVKQLSGKFKAFKAMEDDTQLFAKVRVGEGGYGVIWSDWLDLSCEELFANGKDV